MRELALQRTASAVAAVVVTVAVFLLLVRAAGLSPYLVVAVAYLLGTLAGALFLQDWRWAGMWPAAPVALLAPFYFPAYDMGQIAVLALVAVGANLLIGFAGQVSIAQGTFVGVGAYTTAVLEVHYNWPFYATAVAAVAVSGILGAIIAVPSARLTGIYQVVTTLALAVAFPTLIAYTNYTGGADGLTVTLLNEPSSLARVVGLTSDKYTYFVALLALLLGLYGARNLVRGHVGRAFRAIRDNPVAAQAMGINLSRQKVLAYTLSSMWAGLGGAVYAVSLGVVSPSSFDLLFSVEFLLIIVVGGLGSLAGSVLGAALIWELGLQVPTLTIPVVHVQLAAEIIYGVILVVILIVAPQGIVGLLTRLTETRAVQRLARWEVGVGVKILPFGRGLAGETAPPAAVTGLDGTLAARPGEGTDRESGDRAKASGPPPR